MAVWDMFVGWFIWVNRQVLYMFRSPTVISHPFYWLEHSAYHHRLEDQIDLQHVETRQQHTSEALQGAATVIKLLGICPELPRIHFHAIVETLLVLCCKICTAGNVTAFDVMAQLLLVRRTRRLRLEQLPLFCRTKFTIC